MVRFIELLGEAWGKFEETKWLLPVPIILSLMDYSNLTKVLSFEGFHIGVRFPLPEPVPDLWSFVSVPADPHGVVFSAGSLVIMALAIVLGSYLEAGYLGSIRDAVRMVDGSFLDNAGRDFLQFLQFNLMVYAVTLALILPVMAMPPLFFLTFPGLLLFLYFVYGTPFLISIYGLKFTEALGESINLAKRGGEYLDYALKYLLVGMLISVPLTFIVVNGKAFGILVGLLASAPLSLTLSISTVLFFMRIRGASTAISENRIT